MLSATVVSMSCHLLPNVIIRDIFQEKAPCCVTRLQICGCLAGPIGYWKEMSKKKTSGVVVCMPIAFSRVEESKATFPKIKDVSFFVQTMQIRVFVPHWWQTGRKGGIREALVGAIV